MPQGQHVLDERGVRPAARVQAHEIVRAEGVQPYETGDPLAEQRAYRVGGQVGMAGVVTRTE